MSRGLHAFIAATLAVALSLGGGAATHAQSASPQRASQSGKRILYPTDRPGQIVLPRGQREPIKSLLDIRLPMQFGAFAWDEAGVPAGASWVLVDLDRQIISVFRSGHEIGTAVIVYGSDGKPTPVGAFSVLHKAKHHVSSTYDAPMPFTLRLTRDGVAIHGSNVQRGWATHGCVGVPLEFARRLYGAIPVGGRVVIRGTGVKG